MNFRFRHMMLLSAALYLMAITGGSPDLHAQTVIATGPESSIRIEGRSNVNRFSCNAEKHEGRAEIEQADFRQFGEQAAGSLSLELKIPVRNFECGKKRMNRDMYEALRSDQFSYITFEYRDASALPGSDPGKGEYILEVHGLLTVAGTSREVSFTAAGFLPENGRMRISGEKRIRMTDYDIEPPTGLFGLVRAEDELTVVFDLYADREQYPDNREISGTNR